MDRAMGHSPSLVLLTGYGAGALGVAVTTTVPPLLLLYYLTNTLGVPPYAAGIGLLIPQVIDVSLTPLLGPWSDRMASRFKTRSPLLLAGAILTALAATLLFQAPLHLGWVQSLTYCAVIYGLLVFAATLFGIPHLAMPAEIVGNVQVRTSLISVRMLFVMTGILLSGAAAQPIVEAAGGGGSGYAALSYCLGIVVGATMLLTWSVTRSFPMTGTWRDEPALALVKAAIQDARFRALGQAYMAQAVGAGCALAAWPYYAAYVIGDESSTGLLFTAVIGTSIAAMPAWSLAAGRIGLAKVYRLGTALAVVGCLTMLALGILTANLLVLGGALFLIGLGTAALQLVPFTLMSELSHAQGVHRKVTVAGTYTGLWIATEKIGMALGALVLSLSLWAGGFQEGSGGSAVVQTDEATVVIALAATLVPAGFYMLSVRMIAKVWRDFAPGSSFAA